jgi:hypothetical protein
LGARSGRGFAFEREGWGAAAEDDDLVEAVLQPHHEIAFVAVVASGENNR